jgi:UDP-N-acetylmuramoyl-tripeptide--D-alanyl-D-alanine ligase
VPERPKDIIAELLSVKKRTGKTAGNFNNHVGLPLSILRLADDVEVGVLEIGMNHAGEVRFLAELADPQVGVVTNVGYAHVENFDSLDGVARAKRELIESLPAEGTAVLNADDELVTRFADQHPGPVVRFGFSEDADVRALRLERTPDGSRFEVAGEGMFDTRLDGRHAVSNILAGMAVARIFGIAPAELRDAVASLEPGAMRGRRFTHQGITIFDDCYNSNPEAVRAMIETLRDTPGRRKIAVLGEMLELGRSAETLHQKIGRDVAACGVHVLVGIRGAARQMADAAVAAGLPASAAYFFPEPDEAGDMLRKLAREGDVILFKGSRGTHVERALERFLSPRTGDGEQEGEIE